MIAFHKGHLHLGTCYGERYTGQPSPASDVCHACCVDVREDGKAIEDMVTDDLAWLTNSGEIVCPIPLAKKRNVAQQALDTRLRQFETQRLQASVQLLPSTHDPALLLAA